MPCGLLQQAGNAQCCPQGLGLGGKQALVLPEPSTLTHLSTAQAAGAEGWWACPRVGATVHICVLTEHVLRLVHDILHLFDERLPLGRQDEVMLYLQWHTQPWGGGCDAGVQVFTD